MLFSHVKISSFREKAHLVFHWCLYNNNTQSRENVLKTSDNDYQRETTFFFFSVKFSYSSVWKTCWWTVVEQTSAFLAVQPREESYSSPLKLFILEIDRRDIICMSFMCEHKFLWQIGCADNVACKNRVASWH